MTNERFNGWRNWTTWNVALWLREEFACVFDPMPETPEELRERAEEVIGAAQGSPQNWTVVTPDGAIVADADYAEILASLRSEVA